MADIFCYLIRMKKVGFILFLFFALIFFTRPIFAHPLDVSYTDIHIVHDFNNEKLAPDVAVAEVYLPWFEASLLVKKYENIASPEAKLLPQYHKSYSRYLDEKLQLSNNGKRCPAIYGIPPAQPENEILFGRGIMMPVRYQCPENLQEVTVENRIFIQEFPVQQNYVNIYNGPELAVKGALLTSQSTDFSFDVRRLNQLSTTKSTYGNKKPLLERLSQGFLDTHSTSLPAAIGLVFLLGLLHTLEAGHSKSILTSFLIQKKARVRDGLLFAGIFTVTHIADIVILGLILLLTNSFIDVFARLSYLQTFSYYSLLFISVYMLMKHISEYVKHLVLSDDHEHEHHHHHAIDVKDIRKQLFLGFVTGLSPCLFGWSIFMVILTTKTIWVIFPVIFSFGLGIFVALSLIVFIVGKFKIKMMERFHFVGEISPIISSLLLVGFALSALVQ